MQNKDMVLSTEVNPEIEDIIVGKNHFSDDVWDMNDYVPNKTVASTYKKIKFSYINNVQTWKS